MLRHLTYSEKSAWVMFPALMLASVAYFGPMVSGLLTGGGFPSLPRQFLTFAAILIVLAIIGHLIAAVIDIESAQDDPDERDRQIQSFAQKWGGLTLGFVIIFSLLIYLVIPVGDFLFSLILFALILSHLVESALTIIAYRRGSS